MLDRLIPGDASDAEQTAVMFERSCDDGDGRDSSQRDRAAFSQDVFLIVLCLSCTSEYRWARRVDESAAEIRRDRL